MKTPRFKIGTTFKPIGKGYVCTVTDILTTLKSSGEVHRVCYVATHLFCGQTVSNFDVPEATIARGLLTEPNP
jgi:hypothetical protein